MNGKGGCCIARHAGGGGGGMYGMSKVERIMLKYRPIAPKPVAAGSGSGGSATENSDGYVKCGRIKRKYVRVNNNKKKKVDSKRCSGDKKRKVSAASSSPPPPSSGDVAVTLSLLPETPDRKHNSSPVTDFPDLLSSDKTTKGWNCNCNCNSNSNNNRKSETAPFWLSFNNQKEKVCSGHVGGVDSVVIKPPPLSPPPPPRPQVVSQVTVECVTDTWVGVEGLGYTDEERVMNMEMDTCPGFISDGQDRVVWANKAYRQMAGAGHVIGGEDMSVVLVRKDKYTPAPVTYPAFTCKVKVTTSAVNNHHTAASPPSPTPLTLPCDVWRMKRGACAWRLDVKAALSLGR